MYTQTADAASPAPSLNLECEGAIKRAISIRELLANHHMSLFGSAPEKAANGPQPVPNGLLSNLQLLNGILNDIEDRMHTAGHSL